MCRSTLHMDCHGDTSRIRNKLLSSTPYSSHPTTRTLKPVYRTTETPEANPEFQKKQQLNHEHDMLYLSAQPSLAIRVGTMRQRRPPGCATVFQPPFAKSSGSTFKPIPPAQTQTMPEILQPVPVPVNPEAHIEILRQRSLKQTSSHVQSLRVPAMKATLLLANKIRLVPCSPSKCIDTPHKTPLTKPHGPYPPSNARLIRFGVEGLGCKF